MRSGQDTAITVLDWYDMYAGDKSDAGVGSRRLGRLLCSHEFRFSVSTFFVFLFRNSSARFGRILARKDSALNVRCTLRMRFCTSYISSFKTLFSILGCIMWRFGRMIWVSMGVVIYKASYPMGTRDSFPGGKAAGAWSWPLTYI
jgi:hypothetical protein